MYFQLEAPITILSLFVFDWFYQLSGVNERTNERTFEREYRAVISSTWCDRVWSGRAFYVTHSRRSTHINETFVIESDAYQSEAFILLIYVLYGPGMHKTGNATTVANRDDDDDDEDTSE